ncbi:hypothetical protein [Iodobacter fluviatilis]|nr:hypothetical protein [Iodobacter fluviatilis]
MGRFFSYVSCAASAYAARGKPGATSSLPACHALAGLMKPLN